MSLRNLKSSPVKTRIAALVLLSLLCAAATASAGQIVVEYSFEPPVVKEITLDGDRYDRVLMNQTPNSGNPGEPALPARGASILIPWGATVTNVEIDLDQPVSIGTGFNIEPVTLPFKLSEGPSAINAPKPDQAIYNSNLPFPADRFENVNAGFFRGYQILTLKLQPIEYTPTSGELSYYPQMTITVTTDETGQQAPLYRGSYDDETAVLAKVDNNKEINSYEMTPSPLADNYDMLIITDASIATYFQPLKDYHDSTGILTEIHTTADIGSSDPDDIRDYIRTRYLVDGIEYVLIGGDDNTIPAKNLYVESWSGAGAEIETEMPGDVYYGCLDGTWNYDSDSQWGEPGDGEGGGEVDLIAEVYIGRAPVSNAAEATRFVTKTLTYTATSNSYLQNVLMCGEYLGFGGVSDFAGNMMDQIVDSSSADGYSTIGIPSDVLSVDHLYDRDWWNNDWPQSELVTRINNGLHFINHLGHGNETYAMKLNSSDVSLLTNDDLFFVYSQACLSGHFDNMDCFAEELTVKTDYGAFALIMNARYGWGSDNSTDGPSQRFDREFWDAVYNSTESKPAIGRANHDSKEDNLYRIAESCMRWCYYETNLLGDPAIAIKGVGGLDFSYPDGIPQTVFPDQTNTFRVQVESFGSGSPVPASGQVHYAINGGTLVTESMTVISGDLYEATLPSISCGDNISFYVSAEELMLGREYDPDPASPNMAIAANQTVTAFEDDFETDKSWQVSGGAWARGIPGGAGGDHGNPDPEAAYSGSNVFGYNLDGDYTNSMPEYHLTTPAIDCGNLTNVHLNFQRWLGVEQPEYDHAYLRVSNDGTTWTTVWENGYVVADDAWIPMEYDISAVADSQSTVYVRFTMGTTDAGWTYCGWNIDDVAVVGYQCEIATGPNITTTSLPDGVVAKAYSQTLTAGGGTGTLVWTDKNNDLPGTGLTLSTTGLLSGTPTSPGTVSFTAMVTDDNLDSDEQPLTVIIHEALDITIASLPEGTTGAAYYQTMSATGGIVPYSWLDKDGDLVGTGLALAGDGVLSGTPTVPGTVTFTAMVIDGDSNSDEQLLSFEIYDLLVIAPPTLPDWSVSAPFSQTLTASGGTGAYTWTDKNGDLTTSGLTLAADGTLSGTPTAAGTLSFTALVTDEGSHSDEMPLDILINARPALNSLISLDWTLGVLMNVNLETTGGTGAVTFTDKDGDLAGTGLGLSTGGLIAGTPTMTGPISFTARVVDEVGAFDEHLYEFTINPEVSIVTNTVPEATVDTVYSAQLESEGGTGTRNCEDLNGDLAGTGLTISSEGLLSGTPTDTGTISFTLRVYDEVGGSASRTYDIHVGAGWMCGDLNGDEKITLSDVTILIDHVYISKDPLDIPRAGNVNGSLDLKVTLSDITMLIDHVYISKDPLNCL